MTDAELKEKMEERQMCEEAPGVIITALMMITMICTNLIFASTTTTTTIIITILNIGAKLNSKVCTHLLIFASIFLVVVTLPLSLCLIIKVIFIFKISYFSVFFSLSSISSQGGLSSHLKLFAKYQHL